MDELVEAVLDQLRVFRRKEGDLPLDSPYTRIYLDELFGSLVLWNETPPQEQQTAMKALLGPHGYTIFKVMRLRSGIAQKYECGEYPRFRSK